MSAVLSAQTIDTMYVDSVFLASSTAHKFGGTVLIAQNGRIVFHKSYGYANYETGQNFNNDSRFQIASVSKQFTAFGILFLQQEKKLSIDDYVIKYLSAFPFTNITIRHLLTHTSGLPNFWNTMLPDLDTTIVNGNQQMLQMLQSSKYPLQWKPGEQWEYCDIGFCILASVIEEVSGLRYDEFMNKNLFSPAGMKHTTAELYTDIRKLHPHNMTIGYVYEHSTKKFVPAHTVPNNSFVYWLGGFYGDGSVVTTAHDMLAWDKALYENKIFTKETFEHVLTPAKLNNGNLVEVWWGNYSLGWSLYKHHQLGTFMTHGGLHPGFMSKFMRFIDSRITVVILSNITDDDFWAFTNITDRLIVSDNSRN